MYKLPPNIYMLFPLTILVPNPPPPQKKRGLIPTQKRPGRSFIRWMHFCPRLLQLFGVSVGWSSGYPPHLVEHVITQKTEGIYMIFWAPQSWWWFFFVKGNGRFRAILGKSRLVKMMKLARYHPKGVFFFRMLHLKRSPKPRDSLNLETIIIF